jgi:hypothetical protein
MKRDFEKEITEALDRGSMRFDAGETAFITRELLSIKSKVYQTEYPTLKALDFIPVSADNDVWAEAIAYQQSDGYGKAKIIANNATDLPRVGSIIGETNTPVRTIGAEYQYSWLDLARSARSRAPLVDRLAKRARKTIAEGIDYTMSFGDTESGLIGFTNNSNVHVGAATGNWSGLTAQQMYLDMITAVNLIQTNTNGIHQATGLLLPVSSYALAKRTPWSATGNSDLTVMKFFELNNPQVKVDPWYLLETAGSGSVKRMVVYDKDADVVEAQLPLNYYEFAPQPTGIAFVIPCIARVGGVQVRFPKAMEYVDGL